jgi:hypothetical protein
MLKVAVPRSRENGLGRSLDIDDAVGNDRHHPHEWIEAEQHLTPGVPSGQIGRMIQPGGTLDEGNLGRVTGEAGCVPADRCALGHGDRQFLEPGRPSDGPVR